LPDRARALRFILDGAPWYGRALTKAFYPQIRKLMAGIMDIRAESAKQAETRLLAAFDRLDDALRDRGFLVGDRFSRADLTAAALLSPLCAYGKSDADLYAVFPDAVRELRDRHKSRRFFVWAQDLIAKHHAGGRRRLEVRRPPRRRARLGTGPSRA
jgi:glutathione S-transferase